MKIKKKGGFFVAHKEDVDNTLLNMNKEIITGDILGTISIKTGKFIGNTVALIPLHEHLEKSKPKVVKKTYKVWVIIEERTEFDDGTEVFKDLEDNVQSGGNFNTLEEAETQLSEINANYEGDFTNQ